jgi:hypothetical protein
MALKVGLNVSFDGLILEKAGEVNSEKAYIRNDETFR